MLKKELINIIKTLRGVFKIDISSSLVRVSSKNVGGLQIPLYTIKCHLFLIVSIDI